VQAADPCACFLPILVFSLSALLQGRNGQEVGEAQGASQQHGQPAWNNMLAGLLCCMVILD
jgi:hypothetical protein